MFSMIDVKLVGANGRTLDSYVKDGTVYFAGKRGERYEIEIRNKTGKRLEVVTTVDGLSVMTGEPGNWKTERGYVVSAYDTLTIDGYRRNEDEVAAFRFTRDDAEADSYAGRKDMPENIGAIGIAVFKEHEYPHYHARPWDGWKRIQPIGQHFLRSKVSKGISAEPVCETAGSFSASEAIKGEMLAETLRDVSDEAEIGTEYGEVRHSHVTHTHFRRHSQSPQEVVTVEYDTETNLKRRGVIVPRPEEKNPFPGMEGVKPGYAAPPPPKKKGKKWLPGGNES